VDEEVPTEGWSGTRTAEVVGITYRQLDYWARTDLVRPAMADAKGSGTRRMYSYRNLLELKIIKQLLDAGIRLEVVRDVFTELRARLGDDLTAAKLVISGSSAMLALDDGELIDLVHRGQGVLNILALGTVQEEVNASISQLRPLAEDTGNGAGSLAPATLG
jgi:DNA-binding transcriptional MerR regulator